jgi:hypothetical protein
LQQRKVVTKHKHVTEERVDKPYVANHCHQSAALILKCNRLRNLAQCRRQRGH